MKFSAISGHRILGTMRKKTVGTAENKKGRGGREGTESANKRIARRCKSDRTDIKGKSDQKGKKGEKGQTMGKGEYHFVATPWSKH